MTDNWRIKYGFLDVRGSIFRKFPSSRKPRLAENRDKEDWVIKHQPSSAEDFLGNSHATQLLTNVVTERNAWLMNFVIFGPQASGQSSFLQLLSISLYPDEVERARYFCILDARTLSEKKLYDKIEEFARVLQKEKKNAFIGLEHFECLPSSAQQHEFLPLFLSSNSKKVFFIITVNPDLSKVVEQIKQRAAKVPLKPLGNTNVLIKLLQICSSERIGFTPDGIEELLRLTQHHITHAIQGLQKVFVSYHFISIENVQKTFKDDGLSKSTSTTTLAIPLDILSMNHPLKRCRVCTLSPPCKHVSLEKLYEKLQQTRRRYPDGEQNSSIVVCSSFMKRGICKNIASIGRCKYRHPLDLHDIDTSALVKRCTSHTLPLPCMHCDNLVTMQRKLLDKESQAQQLQDILRVKTKILSELEVERYLFVREQGKVVKWGAAKIKFEERLRSIDESIMKAKADIEERERVFKDLQAKIRVLQDNLADGKSSGLGKGIR